jgi:predicted peptidase
MASTGFLDRSVAFNGRERRFIVYVPLGTAEPLPAILFLHGRGECGADGLFQLINGLMPAIVEKRSVWPFLAVFPQKAEADAEWFDERPMLEAVLSAIDKEFRVDPHRRYLTGLSQGGRGSLRLAKRLPWQFAAVAAVCGWADPLVAGQELKDIPVWLFHGEDDTVIPCERSKEIASAIETAGGTCKLTLYPGVGHNAWEKAYQNEGLADWFLRQTLT